MRKLALMVLMVPVSWASADTVSLASGGKITGTITQATFIRDGEEVVLGKDQLSDVEEFRLAAGEDIVVLGEEEWTGKVKEIVIKSIGGELKFSRSKITGIVKELSERERLRAEYAKRKKALPETDAQGWYALAEWADRMRLRRESQSAARESLVIDPEHKKSADAHRLLGHTFKDGQWLSAAEARELEELEEKRKEEEMRAKGFVKVGDEWVTPEAKERLEETRDRILEMEEDANSSIEDWANARLAEAQQDVRNAESSFKNATREYERAKANVRSMSGYYYDSSYLQSYVQRQKNAKVQMKERETELKAARRKAVRTANALKSKASSLKRAAHNAAVRLIRKAAAGGEVDERMMEDEIMPELY